MGDAAGGAETEVVGADRSAAQPQAHHAVPAEAAEGMAAFREKRKPSWIKED